MLFDLRSRNRRTAVRVIYLLLAVVMALGLIGVGVGTGVGGGGLLNAFSNSGSSSDSNSSIVKQVKAAEKQVAANPTSAQDQLNLLQARYELAQSSTKYYNSTTQVFTSDGKAILQQGVADWEQYVKVTNQQPSLAGAEVATEIYLGLGDYAGISTVYQFIIKSNPNLVDAYACLAYSAYAASHKSLGDLAAARAVQLTKKLDRLELKQTFTSSRSKAATAKQYFGSTCAGA